MVLHLKKLESPSSKDALCQVWLTLISPAVLENKIFYILSLYFCYFVIIPLKKGGALHLNKLESLSLKDALVEIGSAVLEKIFKFLQCIFAIS